MDGSTGTVPNQQTRLQHETSRSALRQAGWTSSSQDPRPGGGSDRGSFKFFDMSTIMMSLLNVDRSWGLVSDPDLRASNLYAHSIYLQLVRVGDHPVRVSSCFYPY